jgi:hypothetical protein
MNEPKIIQHHCSARSRRRARRQSVLERLAELLGRDHPDDPAWAIAEEEKLTRLRLALFGCAPK